MSYNLTTTLYKVKENINEDKRYKLIIFDEHLLTSEDDNFINYFDVDLTLNNEMSDHLIAFENLKEKYKMVKMVTPFFDFLPKLIQKNINPENYIRVEIFNYLDMATYVKKEFLEHYGDDIFDLAHESKFNEDEIIFIYDPVKSEREVDVLIIEEVEGEFTACFVDRDEYHKYLPSPISKDWWGFNQLITNEDFEKFKSVGDKDRPMKEWTFIENENIILSIR